MAHFESAIAFLESVVPPIANAQQKLTPPERSQSVLAALQQLLQQLMAMKVDDAGRCLAQARAIELFAPLTAISPELAAAVIDKVRTLHLATYAKGFEPLCVRICWFCLPQCN